MNAFGMAQRRDRTFDGAQRQRRYTAPSDRKSIPLSELLQRCGRPDLGTKQLDLLRRGETTSAKDVLVHYAGDLEVLSAPCVSIVGTREVSDVGRQRAARLARELVGAGVVVVSGLARGVDSAAHQGAIDNGGRTVAVIGTPLDKAYPAENAALQEAIYREHLLISPFAVGETVYRSNFPVRNRVMAALTDATVIVEASDTSGTLHQAAECQRLGRWLFIMRSVAEDQSLKWPSGFIGKPKVAVLSSTAELVHAVQRA
jgi:DNA protecting protein DprA